MAIERSAKSELAITIPFKSIALILAVLLVVRGLDMIAPLFFPVFFGALIAVALMPGLRWLERKRIPRWLSLTLVTLGLAILVCGILTLVVAPLVQQLSGVVQNLPEIGHKLMGYLPEDMPLRKSIHKMFSEEKLTANVATFEKILGAGNMVLGGLTEAALIFVFAVYLMIDGERVIRWLKAFFSPTTQRKIDFTRNEMAGIITAYLYGQFITSALSFFFVFSLMSVLKIPNALLMATLASVFDILPVLGFFLSVIPAMLFAGSISPQLSLAVLGAFIVYNAIENYVIVPWVYGNRLRVSSLVVFFSLLAAGLIAGVEGAMAVLPIIASYPIIERVWLKPYLSRHALQIHSQLQA